VTSVRMRAANALCAARYFSFHPIAYQRRLQPLA
jgi:hypothetical protein